MTTHSDQPAPPKRKMANAIENSPPADGIGAVGVVIAILFGSILSVLVIGAGFGPGEYLWMLILLAIPTFMISTVASLVGMALWWVLSGRRCYRSLVIPLVILPAISFATGHFIHWDSQQKMELAMQKGRESDERYVHYYETLRADPEIALRERWFEGDKERQATFTKSLKDPNFDYPPSLRERLRQEVPELRGHQIGVTDNTPQTAETPLRLPAAE